MCRGAGGGLGLYERRSTSLYLDLRKFALSRERMAPLLTELWCLLDPLLAAVWF